MALDVAQLTVDRADLHVPTFERVADVLQKGLVTNFKEVSVEVVDCPDLREKPFTLASEGLGGSASLLEVGGPPYLLPSVDRAKIYDLKNLSKELKISPCFVIGAGAGPWVAVGKNCEMMANVLLDETKQKNLTYIAKVCDGNDGTGMSLELLPEAESRFALLANLFCSEGKPSKVLKVNCKQRIGLNDFVTSVRICLAQEFGNEPVGLGGTFLIKSGKARLHVMPDFSAEPLRSDDDLNGWLKFFNVPAPLVAVGTLISSDIPGLDLRVQHFHTFSDHGEGGHYHYDTTPEEVEYIGYFNIAEKLYRVDKPRNSHQMGRD